MRQANASDVSESIPVIMSPVAPLQSFKCRKPTAPLKMTRAVRIVRDLARAADQVQSSGFNRKTRPMILDRFL
eukprot:7387111-Pyramimonas_sp.AAC.1